MRKACRNQGAVSLSFCEALPLGGNFKWVAPKSRGRFFKKLQECHWFVRSNSLTRWIKEMMEWRKNLY